MAYYGDDDNNLQKGGFVDYYGGNGNDFLAGSPGHDQIYGGQGDDVLAGSDYSTFSGSGSANDPILLTSFLVSGDDFIEGGTGDDVAYGADGDDAIFGGAGDESGVHPAGLGAFYVGGLYGGAGNDIIDGGLGNDLLAGGEDHDFLYGGEGADDLFGQEGDDTAYGGGGDDEVYGGGGSNVLFGGAGNDAMAATVGADWIDGEDGDDTLVGGEGNDVLKGGDGLDSLSGGLGGDLLLPGLAGDGSDLLVFNTALGGANVDTILGFELDIDVIVLSQAIFTDIGPTLEKKEFYAGKKAHDGNDFIIYKAKKGELYFDHDGKGGDAQVLFAVVDKKLDLSHTDFEMAL